MSLQFFDEFDYRIAGIPCTIAVTKLENEDETFEYEVYARGKKPAHWLAAKIDDETHYDILQECKDRVTNCHEPECFFYE